uniref:Uncharacterized protein n=1 Tax=Amphora coffeiformis TaxID=265554 RepID=A0A7S3L5P8_9STRA
MEPSCLSMSMQLPAIIHEQFSVDSGSSLVQERMLQFLDVYGSIDYVIDALLQVVVLVRPLGNFWRRPMKSPKIDGRYARFTCPETFGVERIQQKWRKGARWILLRSLSISENL